MRKSLLLKIFILLFVCMLIPLLLLSGINYRMTYHKLKNNLVSAAQQNTEKAAYHFMVELGELFNLSYYVVNDAELKKAMEDYTEQKTDLDRLYQNILTNVNSRSLMARVKYPVEYMIVLGDELVTRFNHSGNINYEECLKQIKDEEWYRSLSGEVSSSVRVFKDFDYVSPNGGEKIYIARNLVLQDGTNAVFVLNIGQYIMDRLIDNYRPSDESSIFIVTDSGMCIAQGERNSLSPDSMTDILQGIGTGSTKERYITLGREELLLNIKEFSFSDIPQNNWAVVVFTPIKSIMQSISYIKYTTFATMILYIIVLVFFFILAKKYIFDRIVKVNQAMERVSRGDMHVFLDSSDDEIGTLYRGFNLMTESLRVSREQALTEEKERIALELSMLQAQITPHFVRNTLNVIRWMAEMMKAEGIARAVVSLTRLLDYNMREFPQGVTLLDEFKNIEEYVYIQKLRYGNTFVYEAQIEEAVKNQKTLKLLMQPIVENCMLHGFQAINTVGRIWMNAYREEDRVIIEISDNGVGISKERTAEILQPEDSSKCSRIGLYNVNKRIQYQYGKKYGLQLSGNETGKTTVRIVVPYIGTDVREVSHEGNDSR